ncbi:MAG TPA: T9SS type A sorting domain-containing protein, partial [Chitinophagales bacterium]|nr:T9SS type A sorting domain-containing protein [Chitinophagales bacterium]
TVVNPLTVVALQPDEQLTYTTALLAPDSIDAAGVIYWHINNLLPTQQRQLVVNFQVPNFSAMGDILNTQAVVNTYDDAGVLLSQNDFDYGAEVVCSYDPNDKQVTPIGIGAQNYTLINDDELVYTIRFQNTGNDTAFNIIITDTLSQYFDHSSFRLITSSHQMQAYRYPSGLVEFRFNHIMLPDSTTNEPRSHGFVQYAVKAVQPVPANTLITNTAYIYFDQNPAVVTNTIESLMVYQIPVGLPIGAMPKFHCYPNPTNTHLSIQQATNEPAFYTLYNAVGQLVATGTFSGVTHTFSVAHLPSGWYYLEVNGERFRVVKE